MSVSEILNKNQFTVTLDGMDFVLRRIKGYMALEALGPDAMAMLSEGGEESPWDKLNYKKQIAFMKSYLQVAMVSPALGEKTDEENDTITFNDLGEYSSLLFSELMDAISTDAEVFPESSEVQEE